MKQRIFGVDPITFITLANKNAACLVPHMQEEGTKALLWQSGEIIYYYLGHAETINYCAPPPSNIINIPLQLSTIPTLKSYCHFMIGMPKCEQRDIGHSL